MAIYEGETVVVSIIPTDPFTEEVLSSLTGSVEVFHPDKDPKTTPADRTPDDTFSATWNATYERYLAYIPTTGFDPGKWSYRARVVGGSYDSWEYGTFSVKE